MAERKRWDKQQEFHPRVDGGSSNPDAKADPVLTKQMQYIKVLEERNRVKKRLAAASKRNDRLQEREEAFVTAFNVPPRAAQSTSTSLASRNTRSATSVLPTKLPNKREEAKLSKCRSAPSTTLIFASASTGDEEDKGVEQSRVRRAKWDRPQAPMAVAVEHQDGVPLFRLTTQSEEKGDGDEEESYLEESFEDFEEYESEKGGDGRAEAVQELVIDEIDEEVEALKSSVDLSKTTKELFGIIQNLSRSKQKALADVLQKFQASEQDEDDVKMLQSSIGDPAIWKEITATLTPSSTVETGSTRDAPVALENQERPAVAPLKNLLEEQLRWEDEYANEMKERLARERLEKQRMLKEAEARRAKMMKQLEDEEREIERLMEVKRQERLAKLRALQDEASADEAGDSRHKMDVKHTLDGQIVPTASVKAEAKAIETRDISDLDEASLVADIKSVLAVETKDPTARQEAVPSIPRLKLAFDSDASVLTSAERYDIHVKLLSTWSKTRAVGLTQICVYDPNGEELSVDLDTLRLYDQPTGRPLAKTNDMVRGLQRLFNGVAHTNSEKDMWLGRLGDSGVLMVAFEVLAEPSKLCIWNYNSRMSTACTRDIEVCVGGKCVWTGSLPETFGDQDDNACTWIDLLGTSRKTTARTARLDESAMSAARSDVKASAQWAETRRSTQQPTSLGNETRSDKSTGSTPLWLTSGVSSSPSTERLPRTSRSNANLDMWTADEKPAAGSLTSRRRQGKSLYNTHNALDTVGYVRTDEKQTHQAEAKYTSSRESVNPEEGKSSDEQKLVAPALSSLSSWDSLEKFSKTNRSRLPQPTDINESSVDDGYDSFEAKAKPSTSRTSFTTSTLLTELRQGTLTNNYASSASVSPASVVPVALASNPLINSNTGTGGTTTDIPVLPSGKWLQIVILSTWGDPYYVGLNGVEIFDHHGELVQFQDPVQQVTACPESINVLEENTDDPRVPKNLVDGVNFTCDDFHMWLAPYTPGESHYVLIELGASVAVSMVRIWNYNKSRTHTCRGVREARLVLSTGRDEPGKVIFEGEIRQAPGLVGADSMELSNEVILFTQESEILEAIENNDEALRAVAREQQREDEETREFVASVYRSMELRRPRTSDSGSRSVEKSPKNQEIDEDEQRRLRVGHDGRPMTMASRSVANSSRLRTPIDPWVAEEPQQRSPDAAKMSEGVSGIVQGSDELSDESLPFGRRLTLYLHSTWGDRNYVGLTQIEVLVGSRGTPIPVDISNLDATPRDLASLGYVGDPRTLDKLVDGEATTCDDMHMWLVPLEAGAVPEIRIAFKQPQYFYGLRVWNYNKSPEDTFRGAKQLVIALDGVIISPKETGFLLRKAPGVADFDFGQLLRFRESKEEPKMSSSNSIAAYSERVRYPFNARAYKTPIVRQDYEAPLYPQGFLLKIVCWTTWGDPYYLGLNGVELYDFAGAKMVEKPNVIHAVPYSVSELDNFSGRQQDTRTPDNLVSGLDKNTWEAHDAWLAPLASSLGNSNGNVVYIGFDTPVVLSMIKFWNYSKTPERGVKDIDIYLDDMHLFSGTLRKAPEGENYTSSKHKVTEQFGQPVLFSSSQAQVDAEKRYVSYCGTEEQDVLSINEGQVMQESLAMYRKPDPGAEGVVVDLELRPMTAVCRQ